jgi:hypothetical protein
MIRFCDHSKQLFVKYIIASFCILGDRNELDHSAITLEAFNIYLHIKLFKDLISTKKFSSKFCIKFKFEKHESKQRFWSKQRLTKKMGEK